MRNKDEFKEEVLRRADAAIKKQARARKKISQVLSMAASFVCIIGILLGVAPMLNRLQYEENSLSATTPSADAPHTTTPHDGTPDSTTPRPSTPASTMPRPSTPTPTYPHFTTPTGTEHGVSVVSTTALPTSPVETSPVGTTPRATTPAQTVPRATTPSVTTPAASSPAEDKDIFIRLDSGLRDGNEYVIRMIPYNSPIRHEEFTLIALSEYEDYKASPYFVYDVISEESFEDQKIYLLISPASGDSLCLKLNMNGYSVRQELPANVTAENGSYCVYAILVSPLELNVTFSPYAE